MSGSNFDSSAQSHTEAEERAQVERIRAEIASGRFSPQEALYREQVRDNAEVVKLRGADQIAAHDTTAPQLSFYEDKVDSRYADLKAEHAAASNSGQSPQAQDRNEQSAGKRALVFHEEQHPEQDFSHER